MRITDRILDSIFIALFSTGAITLIVTIFVGLYIAAVGFYVGGFFIDFKKGVNERFLELLWSKPIKNPFNRGRL